MVTGPVSLLDCGARSIAEIASAIPSNSPATSTMHSSRACRWRARSAGKEVLPEIKSEKSLQRRNAAKIAAA